MKTWLRILHAIVLGAVCCGAVGFASDDGGLVIGVRRDKPSAVAHEWFKPGMTEAALRAEALLASKALVGLKETSEADDLRQGVLREKERCTKEFVWMLNWKNCSDPVLRRGALAGLAVCNPEPKVVGKPLAISAIYEQDVEAR